jgi:hypothetical protein
MLHFLSETGYRLHILLKAVIAIELKTEEETKVLCHGSRLKERNQAGYISKTTSIQPESSTQERRKKASGCD